jgi:hypothetical protein
VASKRLATLVHEGAHLYQHYGLDWNVAARGFFDRSYKYTLDPTKSFKDYRVEQQGAIAEDYASMLLGVGSTSRDEDDDGARYFMRDLAPLFPVGP